MEIRP